MGSKLFSFWSGAPLGWVERLCIASMLEAGHAVDVFTYDAGLAVPDGVALRDARELAPSPSPGLVAAKRWAILADTFRCEALAAGAGTWVDLDVLVLRPLTDLGDHVLGWQDGWVVNNAVLGLPPDSRCLQKLLDLCRAKVVVPPQWPPARKAWQSARGLVGLHTPIEKLPWGAIGPIALTRLAADEHILHRCQPADVFYPVTWQEARRLFDPDPGPVERAITPSTRAIHLWNDKIKDLKRAPPPPGSFMDAMRRRFGIDAAVGG